MNENDLPVSGISPIVSVIPYPSNRSCCCSAIQELRVPCLVVDSIMAFALHKWDSSLKKESENAELKAAKKADLEHEADKQAKIGEKAALRAERKAQEMRAKEGGGKHANFGPSNPIQQPDKNKKSK